MHGTGLRARRPTGRHVRYRLRARGAAAALGLGALVTACPAERPAPPPGSSPGTVVVHMGDDMRFMPNPAIVAAGDTVIWVNAGSLPHTSTNQPGRAAVNTHSVLPAGAAPWDSGVLGEGATFRMVITTPGEYTYLCTIHESMGMVGRLTVR